MEGTIVIDNDGNLIDPEAKNITIGSTTLYYNAARNKFVGIIRDSSLTKSDVTVNDGASETLIYGDLNDDESINTLDAGNIINIYLGNVTPSDKQILSADVNNDASINTLDAGNIINKYLGNVDNFIIEEQ